MKSLLGFDNSFETRRFRHDKTTVDSIKITGLNKDWSNQKVPLDLSSMIVSRKWMVFSSLPFSATLRRDGFLGD